MPIGPSLILVRQSPDFECGNRAFLGSGHFHTRIWLQICRTNAQIWLGRNKRAWFHTDSEIRNLGVCGSGFFVTRPSQIVMVKSDFLKLAHAAGLYRIAIFGHKSGPYQINAISRLNWIPGGFWLPTPNLKDFQLAVALDLHLDFRFWSKISDRPNFFVF